MDEDNKNRGVFRTPIIVPLSVIMVIIIHFGYMFLYAGGVEQGALSTITRISFEVLVLCEVGLISIIVHNKGVLDAFLHQHSMIESRKTIDALKPILRLNMYSSLLIIVFLALGALCAAMVFMNDTDSRRFITAILCIAAPVAMSWYTVSESKLKDIACSDPELQKELDELFELWLHKALPKF